jgi:hypothetical protein
MVGDFERRLAEVLAARLPAPLTGQVFVAPAPAPGAAASLVLGVIAVRPVDPDFLSRRPEVVPGVTQPRRIVRLACDVAIEARPGQNQGRAEQVAAVDAALFALGADDVQSGAALTDATDRGFLIEQMALASGTAPLAPAAAGAPPVGLVLAARGLFWPVGQPGQAGVEIGEIRLRGALLPVEVVAPTASLTAGGPAIAITVRVPTLPSLRLQPAGAAGMPFGALALAVMQPSGRPGTGALAGGTAGVGNVRVVDLADGEATVTYTPPAEATLEELVIALDDHEGGRGVEIGRLPLRVRSA